MPDQISQEHHGPIKKRNNYEIATGEVALKLPRQLADAPRDLFLSNEDALDFREGGKNRTTAGKRDIPVGCPPPDCFVFLPRCLGRSRHKSNVFAKLARFFHGPRFKGRVAKFKVQSFARDAGVSRFEL
jgi:hypothetical protein